MFIPQWVLWIMVLLYAYLIYTDIRLHRRVEKLEKIVRSMEGVSERAHQEYLHQGSNGKQ